MGLAFSPAVAGRWAALAATLLCAALPVSAQLPTIGSLSPTDPLFKQQQEDIRQYYRLAMAGEELPPLLLYRYHLEPDDTLFGIAARLSVPYSAVATLNRLASPDLSRVEWVLLPGIPGLFVPESPTSDLELLISEARDGRAHLTVLLPSSVGSVTMRFYPGEDFLPDERRAFLGVLFRHPVRNARVTSRYGQRIHPVTQEWGFHAGVDFAATKGSPVVAARGGTVGETGYDPIMGNYVLLQHAAGFQTFYGHLDSVAVTLNQEVPSGMILGTVGDSGITTGSHLHFEIRQNGDTRDPLSLLP